MIPYVPDVDKAILATWEGARRADPSPGQRLERALQIMVPRVDVQVAGYGGSQGWGEELGAEQ